VARVHPIVESRGDRRKTGSLASAILKKVGASHYISGPSGRNYLEEEKVKAAGVELEYIKYEYQDYEQLHPPYDRMFRSSTSCS